MWPVPSTVAALPGEEGDPRVGAWPYDHRGPLDDAARQRFGSIRRYCKERHGRLVCPQREQGLAAGVEAQCHPSCHRDQQRHDRVLKVLEVGVAPGARDPRSVASKRDRLRRALAADDERIIGRGKVRIPSLLEIHSGITCCLLSASCRRRRIACRFSPLAVRLPTLRTRWCASAGCGTTGMRHWSGDVVRARAAVQAGLGDRGPDNGTPRSLPSRAVSGRAPARGTSDAARVRIDLRIVVL